MPLTPRAASYAYLPSEPLPLQSEHATSCVPLQRRQTRARRVCGNGGGLRVAASGIQKVCPTPFDTASRISVEPAEASPPFSHALLVTLRRTAGVTSQALQRPLASYLLPSALKTPPNLGPLRLATLPAARTSPTIKNLCKPHVLDIFGAVLCELTSTV
jgi:hypothetical protein